MAAFNQPMGALSIMRNVRSLAAPYLYSDQYCAFHSSGCRVQSEFSTEFSTGPNPPNCQNSSNTVLEVASHMRCDAFHYSTQASSQILSSTFALQKDLSILSMYSSNLTIPGRRLVAVDDPRWERLQWRNGNFHEEQQRALFFVAPSRRSSLFQRHSFAWVHLL